MIKTGRFAVWNDPATDRDVLQPLPGLKHLKNPMDTGGAVLCLLKEQKCRTIKLHA